MSRALVLPAEIVDENPRERPLLHCDLGRALVDVPLHGRVKDSNEYQF